MKTTLMACIAAGTLTLSSAAMAQEDRSHHNHHDHALVAGNAPASIMGDHVHEKGKWMVSYRFMQMHMDGNQNGTRNLSPRDISGDFANNTGVGPATLRIVPTEMTTDMHMFSAMYGVTERLTVMAMANYLDRSMDHITFAGGNPDLEIGRFTTKAQGFGDTKLAALYDLTPNKPYNVVGKIGLSLPTGSLKKRGDIINPAGVTQNIRLPFAMQLGSGTFDLEPALTYTGHKGIYSWGAQYNSQIRLGQNSQGYSLGDKHRISGWGGYQWNDWLHNTLRVTGEYEGQIDGDDDNIAGPVQTADPDNYGGRRVEIGLGFNIQSTKPVWRDHTIGIEVSVPIYQDLNGPQLERDYGLSARYSYSF